ncbi:MAG: SGNH/GDSL hydrolase family protein [Bacteroidales bacterium]|nr:SGNH/GDSL hydrolase family protein [Bacteroidales bacterium]
MRKLLLTLLILSVSFSTSLAQSVIPMFKAGDRVALVGDSITHGGHYHSYIWLYYMTHFPEMRLTLINCGVGGDEAKSILDRWDWDVLRRNPTYITLTFGMNDTGYFGVYDKQDAPTLSQEKVDRSLGFFGKITDRLEELPENVKIVMIGGSPYDETSTFNNGILPGKNAAIRKVIEGQRTAAAGHGWGFVDFNEPMADLAAIAQASDPAYSFCPQDRIHPDKDGQMVMAYLFLKAQGLAGKKVAGIDIDAAKRKVLDAENCQISNVAKSGAGISFDYLAASLPYPCDSVSEHGWGNIHSQRDALKMIPFTDEFNQETLRVRGLSEGDYRLVIDGQPISVFSSADFSKGINMAELTNTPQYRQASAVMYLNEERFENDKRLREYVWMEYNMFRDTDQIFKDDWKSLEMVEKAAKRDPFVNYSSYWYKKSSIPEVRETWEKMSSDLVERIYTINKPVTRHITIEKI